VATGADIEVPSASTAAPDSRGSALVASWLRAWNDGQPATLDSLLIAGFVLNGKRVGRGDMRQADIRWRSRHPTLRVDAQPLISDGRVVGIWFWTHDPAVPDSASPKDPGLRWVGADFLRVEGDSLVEGWVVNDRLDLQHSQ
jgi:hypothetical protein